MSDTEQKKTEVDTDFDLGEYMPKDAPKAVTKPRVHISDNACISCEG
jgi:hypothetical protein